VSESRCDVGARWRARADGMFSALGLHVIDVGHDVSGQLVVTVGAPVLVAWRKRIWRRPDAGCPVGTFSESNPLIRPRAKLTSRAIRWATDALADDDTTVAALARRLGVAWHNCWDAIEVEATRAKSSIRRPISLSARAVTIAARSPKARRRPRATWYSPPPERSAFACPHRHHRRSLSG
jgi:hypothetical protein